MSESNSITFWKRSEFWGSLALAGLGLSYFPDHTVAHQVGTFCNASVGIAVTWFGVKKGYQSDNLPSGLSKVLDKVPDSITGIRGIKNEKGN